MSAVAVVTAVCPVVSVAVAVTARENEPLKFSGGVMVRPARSDGSSNQVPSPLSVPPDNWAPFGTPEMITESVSLPSVSVRATSRSIAIASSSFPAVLENVTAGGWATGMSSASSSAAALGADWRGVAGSPGAGCSVWLPSAGDAVTALSWDAGGMAGASASADAGGPERSSVVPVATPASSSDVAVSPSTGRDCLVRVVGFVSSAGAAEGATGISTSAFSGSAGALPMSAVSSSVPPS